MRCDRVWTGLCAWVTPFAAALAMAPGCGSSNQLAAIAQNCSLNSDCNSPLLCVFTRCHNACKSATDCPLGERCVPSGTGMDNVCQLPVESDCAGGVTCEGNQVCSAGQQCRQPCAAPGDCNGGGLCESIAETPTSCYDTTNSLDVALLSISGIPVQPADASAPEAGSDGAASVTTVSDGAAVAVDATVSDGAGRTNAEASAPFMPNVDAGALGFTPSNVDLTGIDAGAGGDAGIWSNAADVEVSSGCSGAARTCLSGAGAPMTIAMNDPDGTQADLYVLRSLTIDQTVVLGPLTGARPIILLALTTVDIQGQLLVNGSAGTPGAGGFNAAEGPGFGATTAYAVGGGGSYCGTGGTGSGAMTVTPAGMTYGNATLNPLIGGSGGGGNTSGYGNVSAGGGAIQIVAGTSIAVARYGAISAGGEGGGNYAPFGISAGASGGAILLEAPSVVVRGVVAANGGAGGDADGVGGTGLASDQAAMGGGLADDAGNGGGGVGSAGITISGSNGTASNTAVYGSGGGGAGRIRINGANVLIDDGNGGTTNVSPALSTGCATQGMLNP